MGTLDRGPARESVGRGGNCRPLLPREVGESSCRDHRTTPPVPNALERVGPRPHKQLSAAKDLRRGTHASPDEWFSVLSMNESHRKARAAYAAEAWSTRSAIANELLLAARQTRPDREAKLFEQIADTRNSWSRSLEVYDAVVASMEQVTHQMIRIAELDDPHRPVRRALTTLNAAGTMVAREIGCLLELGYLSGAGGRWRALHEIAVTAAVIANCHPIIAERYNDHGFVVGTRRLERFWAQPHPDAPPLDLRQSELDEATRLCALHEPDAPDNFAREYGWAIPLLDEGKSGRRPSPSFRHLEKLADAGHRRLLVEGSANSLVHADSAGVRAAVTSSEPGSPVGSRSEHLHTIGVPALDSLGRLASATHLGFERILDDNAKKLIQLAVGIRALVSRGITIFKADGRKARDRARSAAQEP